MNSLQLLYKRIKVSYIGQLLFVLGLFMALRLLSLFVFYEGFLSAFTTFTKFIFGNYTPALFLFVPYHTWSILLSSLLNPLFFLTLLLFYIPLFIKRKIISTSSFTFNTIERLFIFVPALLLSWELSTYNYNYYLDQPFYFDRAVLIILSFALLRFPLLTPLFIAFAYVYRSQFNYPVEGFPMYDKRLLFDLLVMFVAHVYTRLFIPSFKMPYVFFAVCILAGGYFMGGIIKIMLSPHGYEWLIYNNPIDLFHNVYYRGWLAQASESTLNSIAHFFSTYGKLFQAFAFFIELSVVFILYSRKIGILILIGLLAMHTGIFILAGFLFWKWMAIDFLLLFIYVYKDGYLLWPLFSKNYFKASVFIICFGIAWLQPVKFGWHDTPVNQFFTYEVEDETGKVYGLEKNEMNPYQQWFQMDRFLFLVNKPCLPLSGFGYTGRYNIAKAIKLGGPENFLALEKEQGKNEYDSTLKEKYEDFIKIYFKNRNKRCHQFFLPSIFMAPHHLYNSSTGEVWKGQTPARLFRVIFNQIYTKNGKPIWLNKQIVEEITI